MTANVAKILNEKIRVEKELVKTGIQVFPGKTNFILIKTNIPDFGKKLNDEEVIIYNLSDEWIDGYYRISIGLPEENNILLSTIKKYVKMPKTEAFDQHTNEYDNWFDVNKYVFQSELNALRKAFSQKRGCHRSGNWKWDFCFAFRDKRRCRAFGRNA